jgi:type VI secretion system FHA domain protein
VILLLEVTSPPTNTVMRHSFEEGGGTIGRESSNTWVLPHSKVSGLHAVVTHRGGTFFIEDRSRNGVYLNSTRNRLERGREQPLKSGDRIMIEPYEIRVSITRDQHDRGRQGARMPAGRSSSMGFDSGDPFGVDDPFAPQPMVPSALELPDADVSAQELDPLELLNLNAGKRVVPPRNVRKASDLDGVSILDEHYAPPAAVPEPSFESHADPNAIPEDYDPLAPDDGMSAFSSQAPPPRPHPAYRPPEERRAPSPPLPPPAPRPVAAPLSVAPLPAPPVPAAPVEEPHPVEIPAAVRDRPPAPAAANEQSADSLDFREVLRGAGLDPANVTPEIAREFGQILRVVVSGVMDVMRSRQQIKDEFRMQGTRVRRLDNNPLKFAANVDDALHNLLLKRNAAYMSPVEAFEDAFSDLRNHQIAMLAGMRTAFEAMLAEFDPDRLQEEFDRQLAKGLVPAKLRYWDSYRERQQQAAKDPEATFRRLFGEEFARAYEDQLRTLKSQDRSATGGPPPAKPSES